MSVKQLGNSTDPVNPTSPRPTDPPPKPVIMRPPGDSTGKGDGSGVTDEPAVGDGTHQVLPVVGVESDILQPKISG